ncbi:MAG: hypothetical protein KDA42_08340 [Planctomycetales bacterium]|nr:hypothetical protein [Planctomycetales bacterium]
MPDAAVAEQNDVRPKRIWLRVVAVLIVIILVWFVFTVIRTTFVAKARLDYESELMHFAFLYHAFYLAEDRSPQALDELINYVPDASKLAPYHASFVGDFVAERIRSGKLKVVWNADYSVMKNGVNPEGYVLAYETEPAFFNPYVAYADGMVGVVDKQSLNTLLKLPTVDE